MAVLVDPADRVALDLDRSLDRDADGEGTDAEDHDDRNQCDGQTAESHDDALDERLASLLGPRGPLTDAEQRGRQNHPGDQQDDHPDGEQHTEVTDHRDLRDPQREEGEHRSDDRRDQRGHDIRQGRRDRVRIVVEHDFFLDPVVDLDGEVDAEADQDRQARDGDQRQIDAEVAQDREGPDDAEDHTEQGKQPPPHPEHQGENDCHDAECRRAELQHAALEVVVDVAQIERCAGRRDLETLEFGTLDDLDDGVGAGGQRVEIGIALEDDASDGRLVVGEGRRQRQPDRAIVAVGRSDDLTAFGGEPGVVVEQQLDPVGIAELLLADARESGQAQRHVGTTCGSAVGVGIACLCREQRVAARALQQRIRVHQRDEGRDDRGRLADPFEVRGDAFELGEVVTDEEILDAGVIVGRREEQHDGLATELRLEPDVVERDLRIVVQVAVLARGELGSGEPGQQRRRDHQQAHDHPDPSLAQLNTGVAPELFHVGPSR